MEQFVEVYQPMPDNIIRIHTDSESKKVEVFASYKDESNFSVCLTHPEADWLASELKLPHGINWIRLANKQVLRVVKIGEVRQIILSDIKAGQEIHIRPIGIVLEDVLEKVIDALKA